MARRKQQKRKQSSRLHTIILSVTLPLVGLFLLVTVGRALGQTILLLQPLDLNYSAQPDLQLRTIPFITIEPTIPVTPTPLPSITYTLPKVTYTPVNIPASSGPTCSEDVPVSSSNSCSCFGGSLSDKLGCDNYPGNATCPDGGTMWTNRATFGTNCIYDPGTAGYQKWQSSSSCYRECIAKPVIYLYPEKPTNVSVSLTIPGSVVKSDPLYPASGWQNVLAQPDGTLHYQGKTYRELFYETSVTTVTQTPPTGMVVASKDLVPQLTEMTTKLGLRPDEQQEFLEYWVPTLQSLHSPYMLVSIMTPTQKEAVDHVSIQPAPQTRIEFLAYFKPLQEKITIAPLVLPATPPARVGFTEVEWGGTIDLH